VTAVSVIGELKNAGSVERAAVARLRERMSAYAADAAAQDAGGKTPPPLKGVIRASELEAWPEDQKPVAVVISPGTVGAPTKRADGYYTATYSLAVAVIVSAKDDNASRDVAQLYGAAVRGCMLQGRTLRRAVTTGDWRGESFDDLSPDPRRTLFASVNLFYVELDEIVSWKEGPGVDPDGEWPDPVPTEWPTAETVEEVVEAI
jgi:hypothetical protein